jgi:hypothetical protein
MRESLKITLGPSAGGKKCGFTVQGQEVRFANARAAEIKELVLKRERPRWQEQDVPDVP